MSLFDRDMVGMETKKLPGRGKFWNLGFVPRYGEGSNKQRKQLRLPKLGKELNRIAYSSVNSTSQ